VGKAYSLCRPHSQSIIITWFTSKYVFYSTNLQCNPYSSRERFFLIKLDDCSILQCDHLVRNRSSPECMIRSALQTSASHGFDCSSVRLMGRVMNEHVAWLDLGENPNTPSGLVTPIPHLGQGFKCPVRRAQALRHTAVTLRPGHTQEKLLLNTLSKTDPS
jgi:hypothetical protein